MKKIAAALLLALGLGFTLSATPASATGPCQDGGTNCGDVTTTTDCQPVQTFYEGMVADLQAQNDALAKRNAALVSRLEVRGGVITGYKDEVRYLRSVIRHLRHSH